MADPSRRRRWSGACSSDRLREFLQRRDYSYNEVGKLYSDAMATLNISAARSNLPDAVERARTEPVFLQRYGRPAAVLISPERYALLMAALDDAEDVVAFDAAIAEEGPNIPWEQAKADLGWQ